jgi:hypothetical protein
MITQITKCQFSDAFHTMGRENNFSYDGRNALYDYFTELEEDCGTSVELDVIAICCEFSEYDSPLGAAREYVSQDAWSAMTEDDANKSALNWMRDQTTVIELENGGVVIQDW